jgi:hypothetical protein
MIQSGLIFDWDEGLVRAFSAPDSGKLADAADELVGARRRVPRLPGPPALEPGGEDVLAAAEELTKEPHLLQWRGRERCGRKRKEMGSLSSGNIFGELLAQSVQTRTGLLSLAVERREPSFFVGDPCQQAISHETRFSVHDQMTPAWAPQGVQKSFSVQQILR